MNTLLSAYIVISQRGSACNRLIGQFVAWFTLLMVLLVSGIVLVRTFGNTGSIGAQELTTYLHAAVIMLASGYTLAEHEHVRVDVFYRKFSHYGKAWVNLLGSLLLLLPFALASTFISWNFVQSSWAIREASADAGGLPAIFLLKSLLIVNGGLLTLQALADICEQLATLIKHDTQAPTNTSNSKSQ